MRRGPKGASIETQLEVTATRTWRFSREELVKRLGLPGDARVYMQIPEGWTGEFIDVGLQVQLVAVATETRKPAVKT